MQRRLQELLSEPHDRVLERESTAFDRLLAQCNRKLVLFGAGNLGKRVLACLRLIGIEPLAFADNAPEKWGGQVEGLPVLAPHAAAEHYGSNAIFFITIWSEGRSYREAREQLQGLGCKHVHGAAPIRWKFADQLLPALCQDLPHKVYEQAPEVIAAGELWHDRASREEYLNQIRWRALGDHDAVGIRHAEESYFTPSLFQWIENETFVDCGAYTGDTAQRLLELRNGSVARILALEPDAAGFERLRAWKGALPPAIAAKVSAARIATSAKRGQARFHSDGGDGGSIHDGGETVVECAPLDELLAQEVPTFIKMDIEGAELEALAGAEEVIRRCRPLLAVCVYHRQSDVWRVPQWIHSRFPDYRLYLRAHAEDGWQLVCYAVPPRRAVGS